MKARNLYSGKRFGRALRAFVFGRAAQAVANLILTLWVVRLLGLSDYGAYMVLWGLVEMMVPLSSFGLLEAARRFMPELAARGSAAGVRAFVRGVTLARLVILLAWAGIIAAGWPLLAAALGFNTAQAAEGWGVIGLIVALPAFRYAAEMLETLLEQRWSQSAQALLPIMRLAGVGGLVATGSTSLAALLWIDLAASLVCLVLAEWALLRRLRTLDAAGSHRVGVREVARFAWHMAGVNLLQATASMGAMRLLAARVLGLEAAALFAFLQQLLNIVNRYMPSQLLANLIRPMLIARRAAGETGVVGQGLGLMWKSNLLIVLAGLAVIVVGGNLLLDVASGGRFDSALAVMLLLTLGLGVNSQGLLINMAMQIHDRTRALRVQSLFFPLVLLAAWLGAQAGLVGFVAGMVGVQALRNTFALVWMRRHDVPMALDWGSVVRTAGWTALAAGPAWLLAQALGQVWGLALLLLLLLGSSLLARPLSATDEAMLARALKGRARLLRPFVARTGRDATSRDID